VRKAKDTRPSLRAVLRKFHACEVGMEYLEKRVPHAQSTQELWDTCRRGDFLAWLVYTAFGIDSSEDHLVWSVLRAASTYARAAVAIRRVITWPVVERALLDRYLRETGSVSS
jgi:hypothetical protein